MNQEFVLEPNDCAGGRCHQATFAMTLCLAFLAGFRQKTSYYLIFFCSFFAVFLLSFIDGLNYTWFAGNYKFIHGPNAKISLSKSELSIVASLIHFGRLVTPVIMMFVGRRLGRKPVLIVSAIFMLVSNSLLLATRSALILQISRYVITKKCQTFLTKSGTDNKKRTK